MSSRTSRYVMAYVIGILTIAYGAKIFCTVTMVSDGFCYSVIVLLIILLSTVLLDQYNWKSTWYSDDEE